MKQLVVLCHPLSENLSKLIHMELSSMYDKYQMDFTVRDLYQIGFNPIISAEDISAAEKGTFLEDVLCEQEHISNTDILTFIYPVGLTGMPALLKGYIDRVFSEGFAYSVTEKGIKKLLEGKKAIIVNTFDKSSNLYKVSDRYGHSSINEKQLFESCGMEVILHYYLENEVNDQNDASLRKKIEDMKIEIKKSLILSKNSHLSIPTAFF